MKNIYIDGQAGTTGLRIRERLAERDDVTVLTLPEDKRKDTEARREIMNSVDFVFLCLPDAAAREAVTLIENPAVRVLDTSTAHRTNPAWAYGFPELDESFCEKIKASNRIAEAVMGTAGEVLVYDGKLCDALYHACSGGQTEDSEHVYANALPYLRGVDSPYEDPMRTEDVAIGEDALIEQIGRASCRERV